MNDNRVAYETVNHKGRSWVVSTINRQSSYYDYPAMYAETMVFEVDPVTGGRGRLIDQGEDVEGSRDVHDTYVRRLAATGKTRINGEE